MYVAADEVHDLSGSRGVANFVLKWAKDSKREAYLNIEEVKNVTRPLTGAQDARMKNIRVVFACKGWA